MLLMAGFFCSCSENDLSSTSVVVDSINEQNEFDLWLEENYRASYNIKFKYKYEDIESDLSYDVVPNQELYSKILAQMVKFLWLEAYTEAAGLTFMRTYAPRVMMTVGSGAYNSNGTIQLGTAEGGLKITVYVGNWIEYMMDISFKNGKNESNGFTITNINIDYVNNYYLHTIHHEFAHILDQTKSRPKEFDAISAGSYTASWYNMTDSDAAVLGFVSTYASAAAGEDWVEVLSYYITLSDEDWDDILSHAGSDGAAIIKRKLELVKSYMQDVWNINLDELKSILLRRYSEVYELEWDNFSINN